MHPFAPTILTLEFAVIGICVAGFWAWLIYHAYKTPKAKLFCFAGAAVWLVVTCLVAGSGVLRNFASRPPPLMLFLGALFLLTVALALSKVGAKVARASSFTLLIGFQMFRFPLEIVMDDAAWYQVMPVQMSFSGYNFDILTAITAILLVLAYRKEPPPRALVFAWNIFGIILLANIIGIAIASTPMFQAFGSTPEKVNTFVTYPPFIWLPSVMVTAALFGHIVITRKLFEKNRAPD